MGRKTVLLLGAGASLSDVASRPLKHRPPLDRRFFDVAVKASSNPFGEWRAHAVRDYMLETYGVDIFLPENDSLEGVMGRLYPDLFNTLLADRALRTFRALLQLFTARLATTTNSIRPTQKRFLYRMLSRLLSQGCRPSDITIITFNQDLQIEKTLEHLGTAGRWKPMASQLFSFPSLYAIDEDVWERVTGPTRRGKNSFVRSPPDKRGIQLLKLHGSLNWYSTHTSSTPSRSAMFRVDRKLSVTRRKLVAPDMTLTGKRKVYTLPVIVPPVNHKSSVLHAALGPVWTLAEERLAEAEDLVIFGYSCPALDFESANLLTRAQRERALTSTLSIIDPNGAVATRYIDLLCPSRLNYYASAKDYLAS